MPFRRTVLSFLGTLLVITPLGGQTTSSTKKVQKPATASASALDPGLIRDSTYYNNALGFSCKIPPGWVLRTEDMNAREEIDASDSAPANKNSSASGQIEGKTSVKATSGQVLLAAFSRPPEARGEDVNSSIVIAAEPISAYPGLKQAAQYFAPLTEVAKAQGFQVVDEPHEFQAGTKTLVRGDFQKDVGTRVMRQATLVRLVRGYAVSFTFIGGTEDEVEELVNGISFNRPPQK